MGLDIGYSTPYYGHFSRDNHVSFGVRLAIPAFQVRSGPMANSANPDLHGMMSYIWVVARIEERRRAEKEKAKQKKKPEAWVTPSSIRGIN